MQPHPLASPAPPLPSPVRPWSHPFAPLSPSRPSSLRTCQRSVYPPALPPPSRASTAHATHAARLARTLGPSQSDTSTYGFSVIPGSVLDYIFRSIGDVIDAAVPEGTLLKDDLSWRRWLEFTSLLGTPPWRTDRAAHSGADPTGFDKECRLQCAFLIWCYSIIPPRSKSAPAPRPQSAYNMLAGVRRIHRRANIEMVATSLLAAVMKGITMRHVREHGSESLLPERKEPIGPDLTRLLLGTPVGTALGSKRLDWSSPLFLSLGAMIALAAGTGFRKAEVALPAGCDFDDRRLRRSSLLWEIDGVLCADPSPALLGGLVSGRDKAVLKPPRSKADQDGTIFGALPIYQLFDTSDVANSAAWLQRLELAFPCHGADRARSPLFISSATFAPFTHAHVDTYLSHLLRLHVPKSRVSAYSFHSFRIGYACALLAAGCPPGLIQSLVRWSSQESLKIYARLNPSDYVSWTSKALLQKTDSTTGARLPCAIDADALYATFPDAARLLGRADSDVGGDLDLGSA